ncbi:MAG: PPW family C-terminal domain-containing PPE protein [Mycobacterium sp.]
MSSSGGPLGSAGSAANRQQSAAGFTRLAGDGYGGGPIVPMLSGGRQAGPA